ncbi:flavodoxin [Bacillus sp. SRB_336]|nr:flavodoxin [Bacillus sp. SRB_336]
MHAIVVYESMYGNTRHVAEAVARGLGGPEEVQVVPVLEAAGVDPGDYDLVVVGGPTHLHGMSRESTRRAAEEAAEASSGHLVMEPDAAGEGVREWITALSGSPGRAAAFDTRVEGASLLTGRASKGIDRHLRGAGFTIVAPPESFLVTGKDTHLRPGEETRAHAWGESLAARVSSAR